MPTPTEGSGTSFDRIQVNIHEMVTLLETGGTFSILSYEIQMLAPGSTVWESIVGGGAQLFTLLTFTQTGLITGGDYQFRARASNSFGWGEFSDVVTIRADDVPAQIAPLTTSVENIYARISWSLPSTTNGAPILEYAVYILGASGLVQSSSCDGSDPDIVNSLVPSCLVPMTELRAAPYNLTQGAIV